MAAMFDITYLTVVEHIKVNRMFLLRLKDKYELNIHFLLIKTDIPEGYQTRNFIAVVKYREKSTLLECTFSLYMNLIN